MAHLRNIDFGHESEGVQNFQGMYMTAQAPSGGETYTSANLGLSK